MSREVPCIVHLASLVLMSCMPEVQPQNQIIVTGAAHQPYSDTFYQFYVLSLCMCVDGPFCTSDV